MPARDLTPVNVFIPEGGLSTHIDLRGRKLIAIGFSSATVGAVDLAFFVREIKNTEGGTDNGLVDTGGNPVTVVPVAGASYMVLSPSSAYPRNCFLRLAYIGIGEPAQTVILFTEPF
jgi:hypothetical protein